MEKRMLACQVTRLPLNAWGGWKSAWFACTLMLVSVILGFPMDAAALIKLPASGQTLCYEAGPVTYNEIPCPAPGNSLAQDGSYYFINPRSYEISIDEVIVQDNNTGLVWQRDEGFPYNWYQASGTYNALDNASSEDYCGSLTLGGYSDWRLPSKKELITLVDYSVAASGEIFVPTIDAVFTNTGLATYWSSTSLAGNPDQAWGIGFGEGASYFYGGDVYASFKDYAAGHVRCVRGLQTAAAFIDNGSTVTDGRTGLIWQKEDDGFARTWGDALSYCNSLSLAGQGGWRVPTIIELESITDDSRVSPAAAPVFTNTKAFFYWSSTTYTDNPYYAWDVGFGDGIVYGYGKDGADDYVRCVQSGALITVVPGAATFTSRPAGISCGADCIAPFLQNSDVAFVVIPGSGQVFSGLSCDPNADNTVTVTGNMTCTANFTSCDTTVAWRSATGYSTVALAYAGASTDINNRETINITARKITEPSFNFSAGRHIVLDGGYSCLSGKVPSTYTVLSGTVTIGTGSVVFENIVIM